MYESPQAAGVRPVATQTPATQELAAVQMSPSSQIDASGSISQEPEQQSLSTLQLSLVWPRLHEVALVQVIVSPSKPTAALIAEWVVVS